MRAARILASRPERAIIALAELCEERKEEDLISPPPFVPPRLSPLPPQTPYTVGSLSLRPKGAPPDRLSPPTQFFEPGPRSSVVGKVSPPSPPEHMAARRSKWTCPPPPEASPADHTLFEDKLGKGLKLATASTDARENETASHSSPGNSEILSDDEHRSDAGESDDVLSVRSFTEGSVSSPTMPIGRALRLHSQESLVRTDSIPSRFVTDANIRPSSRGRISNRIPERMHNESPLRPRLGNDFSALSRAEISQRSLSGSPRPLNGFDWPSGSAVALVTPLPPSPITPNNPQTLESVTIYQTPSPRPSVFHLIPGSQSPLFSQYGRHQIYIPSIGPTPQGTYPNVQLMNPRASELSEPTSGRSEGRLDTPTPASYARFSHSHTPSTSTITSSTPLPNSTLQSAGSSIPPTSPHESKPPSPPTIPSEQHGATPLSASASPASTSNSSHSHSPTSSGYATSVSPSPPPPPTLSPSPPPTAHADPPLGWKYPNNDVYPPSTAKSGNGLVPSMPLLLPQLLDEVADTPGNGPATPRESLLPSEGWPPSGPEKELVC